MRGERAIIPRIDSNLFDFSESAGAAASRPCIHGEGFTHRGMVLELSRRARAQGPDGFSLAPLSTDEEFQAFARIVTVNLFRAAPEAGSAFASILQALDPARAFCLLGSYEGQTASAAFAFIDGAGVGGVYFVATEEALRGRGFGAATVSGILDGLARRGAKACILQATDSGRHVYEQLGFEEACRLGRFSLQCLPHA